MDIKWISQHDIGIPTRARRPSGCPDSPPAPYQSSDWLLIAPQVPQEHWSAMTASKFLTLVSVSSPVPKGWWHIFPLLKRSMITLRWPVNSYCCWGKDFHKNSSSVLTLLMNMRFFNDMTHEKPKDLYWRQSDFSFSNKKEEWLEKNLLWLQMSLISQMDVQNVTEHLPLRVYAVRMAFSEIWLGKENHFINFEIWFWKKNAA